MIDENRRAVLRSEWLHLPYGAERTWRATLSDDELAYMDHIEYLQRRWDAEDDAQWRLELSDEDRRLLDEWDQAYSSAFSQLEKSI